MGDVWLIFVTDWAGSTLPGKEMTTQPKIHFKVNLNGDAPELSDLQPPNISKFPNLSNKDLCRFFYSV